MDSSDKAIAAYKILMKSEPDRAVEVATGTRFYAVPDKNPNLSWFMPPPIKQLRFTGYYFADPKLGQITIAIDEQAKTVYYWQSESE